MTSVHLPVNRERPWPRNKENYIAVETRKKEFLSKGNRSGAGSCQRRKNPGPRCVNKNKGTSRLTVTAQSIVMSASVQKNREARSETKQCGSNRPKGLPQAELHIYVESASQGGYQRQFANFRRIYAALSATARGTIQPHVGAEAPVLCRGGPDELGQSSLFFTTVFMTQVRSCTGRILSATVIQRRLQVIGMERMPRVRRENGKRHEGGGTVR